MNLSVVLRVGKTVWGFSFFLDEMCVREWEKKSRSRYSSCGRNNALSVSVTLDVLYITHMSSAQVLTAFLNQNETLSDRSVKSCQNCIRAALPLQLTLTILTL